MSVAAAITSFNRLDSLKRCIAQVRAQTRPVDEIIVVDDASTDGTGAWLAGQEGVVAIIQPENYGCSMSFHVAMRTAYEHGHDWVWTMDHDVYADPDALEILLAEATAMRAAGVRVGGLKPFETSWRPEDGAKIWDGLPQSLRDTWRHGYAMRRQVTEIARERPVPVVYFTYCGTLFAREALAEVGFPDPAFFYGYDDLEYCLRLHERGFCSFVVPQATVEHPGGDNRLLSRQRGNQSPWRAYYSQRNQWALLRTHRDLLGPGKTWVCGARLFLIALIGAVRCLGRGKYQLAGSRMRGLADGLLGRMGRRVSPLG